MTANSAIDQSYPVSIGRDTGAPNCVVKSSSKHAAVVSLQLRTSKKNVNVACNSSPLVMATYALLLFWLRHVSDVMMYVTGYQHQCLSRFVVW